MTNEETKQREEARRKVVGPSKDEMIDISVDGMINQGAIILSKIMSSISSHVPDRGLPAKGTVSMLKDCMTMLHELKKKEKELANGMTEEELLSTLRQISQNEKKSG